MASLDSTYALIFSKETLKLAGLMGVAWSNKLLSAEMERRWFHFMCKVMPAIYARTAMPQKQYEEISNFIDEMNDFVRSDVGPTKEQIEAAEKARPKGWVPPMTFQEWIDLINLE
ncbi:hypothetical protein F5884DRAFT_218820 [Xylogone sp. PMI_703]|nr:hypothetical protein F5884DRAFT_218820 [Xylogone sp. PMI_703]